ncbi:hypothetical protein IAR55_005570 [Kwoniella newhampshirensis]|uniref:Zn(2)-C6 fungal-type domain-containing protein n=1 Tax=Kwoniella newhampshirensis TaxID=1651941 RepID=A0AAW0YW41_9TREE
MNPAISDDAFKPRFTRTKTGCLRCRKGKHKCDEEKPVCRRCQHAKGQCVYPPPPTPKQKIVTIKRPRYSFTEDSNRFEELDENGRVRHRPPNRGNGESSGTPFSISMAPTDPLIMTFPDPQERELMKHLLCFGTVMMYAIPIDDKPVQFLDITQCLQHPRGSSFESDAQLLSLISIAAIHQSSIYMQQEKRYLTSSPVGRWGTPSILYVSPTSENQQRMRAIGDHCSNASLELCKAAIALKMRKDQRVNLETLDMLLSSTVSVVISRSLAGDANWKVAFEVALKVIELRGGPAKMLEDANAESKSALLRVRTLLENLVVMDVCHCLASGSAPSLMFEPFAPWWFDYSSESSSPDETDTVHTAYGMDRGMVELMNRINMLVHENMALSALHDQSYISQHEQKVQDLLLELEIWENNIGEENDLTRVQVGNLITMHSMRVVIYVDLLHYPHSDPVVQSSASSALRILETSRDTGWVIGLLLPTVIAGSLMVDVEGRDLARKLLSGLRSTFAFSYDVEEALRMLERLYTLRDQGAEDPSWRQATNSGLLFL